MTHECHFWNLQPFHNILELVDILPNVFFTTNETERIITNKNGKYELTDELPNDVRLTKI